MDTELSNIFFSCKNISIDLGGREILRNINIDIKPGEVLGIIGPNGAGKTSLIEILCGRYKQKTGDVIYKNLNINRIFYNSAGGHSFPSFRHVWAVGPN